MLLERGHWSPCLPFFQLFFCSAWTSFEAFRKVGITISGLALRFAASGSDYAAEPHILENLQERKLSISRAPMRSFTKGLPPAQAGWPFRGANALQVKNLGPDACGSWKSTKWRWKQSPANSSLPSSP